MTIKTSKDYFLTNIMSMLIKLYTKIRKLVFLLTPRNYYYLFSRVYSKVFLMYSISENCKWRKTGIVSGKMTKRITMYNDAVKLLTSKGKFYINLGLDRISSALEKFGNPQDKLKYIHVAGTNGKGSVCTMLDAILREAGYKTGLYTSPHIWDYTERIKINGKEIPQDEFEKYINEICGCGIHLTEFEILTVMMFLYFARNNVDIVILETGLGGRFDATNVIKDNLCSIITHIDLDHTERLGKTKDEIAFEKAGIIKKGCPVITSEGYEAIKDKADEMDSLFILATPFVNPEFTEALSLKGLHQQENLALVINAVNYLFKNISSETIAEALKKVKNPCRFQYFPEQNLIVDASHNPNSIKALRDNLDYYFPNEKRRFVFGCLKNKDFPKMMNTLFRTDDEIYLNSFDYPNACDYDILLKNCPAGAEPYRNETVLTPDKLNIICGSFYMIGGMKWLKSLQA